METSTSDVLNHHLSAFGEGNVEEILKDYTEDSIILHPDGVVKGLQQIEAFFTEVINYHRPCRWFSGTAIPDNVIRCCPSKAVVVPHGFGYPVVL
jgi:hypothetical protein